MLDVPMFERRANFRSNAPDTLVIIVHKKKRYKGFLKNISVGGACIQVTGLGTSNITKNSIIDLTFSVKLNSGKLSKLYFKQGVVTQITGDCLGVSVGERSKKS